MAKRKPSSKSGQKSSPPGSQFAGMGAQSDPVSLLVELIQSGATPAEIHQAINKLMEGATPSAIDALRAAMDELGLSGIVDDNGEDDGDDWGLTLPSVRMTKEQVARECQLVDQRLKRTPNNVGLLEKRAQLALTVEEAIEFQQRAFDVAAKKLGNLKRYEGRFWSEPKTRPYLIARLSLARYLWEAHRTQEARTHLEELLAINPDDQQGARYRLLKLLVDTNCWNDAEQLMTLHSDDAVADMQFTAVLASFRRAGDCEKTRGLLKNAMRHNRHVVSELLCEPPSDDVEDDSAELESHMMILGGLSEARDHAQGFRAAWRTTPGAISWLRTAAHQIEAEFKASESHSEKDARARQVTLKELRAALRSVKKLPVDPDEEWIVDLIPTNKTDWGLLIVEADELQNISSADWEFKPTVETIAMELCEVMSEEVDEIGAYRPERLSVIREELLAPLQKWFEQIGISVEMAENAEAMLQMSDRAFTPGELPDTPMTDIPQDEDVVWEVDWRNADTWVQSDSGELRQPWVMMVLDRESEGILQNAMDLDEPTADMIDHTMRRAVLLPQIGEPHRPGRIVVSSGDSKVMLSKWLKDAHVHCEIGEFEILEEFFEKMRDDLFPEARPSLIDTEGATPELIGQLFEVSARYFKAAPWRSMRPTDIVAVTCPQITQRTFYAAGMGQNGEGMGFMLFEDPYVLRSMFGPMADSMNFRGVSLTLEEKHLMAAADLAAAEQFGWPVVTAESWPMLVNMDMEEGMTPVDLDEIRMAIVAAHVILDFWKSPDEARRRGAEKLEFALEIDGERVVATGQLFLV